MAILKPWKPPNSDVWWFRRSVPADVRGALKRTEWRESLQTRSLREAEQRILPRIAETTRLIADARAGRLRQYDQHQIDMWVWQWSHEFDESLRQTRYFEALEHPTPPLAAEVLHPISSEEELESSLKNFLDRIEWGDRPRVTPGSADYQVLKKLAFELHHWTYVKLGAPQPLAHLSEPVDDAPSLPSALTISSVFQRYENEAGERLSNADRGVAVRRFIDVCGDLSIKDVAKVHARQFKRRLELVPARMPEKIRQQSVEQQIAWASENNQPRISPASVNKQLSMLRSLLAWAYRDAGLFDDVESYENPFGVVAAHDDRSQEEKRTAFSTDDLRKIFSLEFIRNPKHPENRWLPLLALYTGARLEEMGQLLLSDIRMDSGRVAIHLSEFDEDGTKSKRLKTVGSARVIPIHPKLVELGFNSYVAATRRSNSVRLFGEMAKGAKGKLTAAFSKRINRQIRQVIPDKRKTFHSFRHTFKAACQRSMIPEDITEALMGHSSKKVGRSVYGDAMRTMTDLLFDAISKIHYPGLDLDHLRSE